jgi:hypothetical protein
MNAVTAPTRITTESLRANGYPHAVAYEATCPNCRKLCTLHSTGGGTPDELADANGYNYGHPRCGNAEPAWNLNWQQV